MTDLQSCGTLGAHDGGAEPHPQVEAKDGVGVKNAYLTKTGA